MKRCRAAALVLGIELPGCGSRLSHDLSLLDWFALCIIFLIVVIVGIGLVGLAKTIRK